MQKDTAQAARLQDRRLQRGKALADAGGAVRHGDLWVVAGTARSYTVDLDHDYYGATCSCPDWFNRMKDSGGQCKHIVCALLTESRNRCKRRKRVDRRHKSDGEGLRGIVTTPDQLDRIAARLGV